MHEDLIEKAHIILDDPSAEVLGGIKELGQTCVAFAQGILDLESRIIELERHEAALKALEDMLNRGYKVHLSKKEDNE